LGQEPQPEILRHVGILILVHQDEAKAILKLSQDLGLLADYSSSSMRVHYRSTRGIVPFTYRRDLSFKEFARFAENNVGIPGVTVTRTGRRRYLYDSLACHVLGYLNLADIDQVPEEKKRDFNYYVGDDYGVMGIEKTMDHYLQGKPGKPKVYADIFIVEGLHKFSDENSVRFEVQHLSTAQDLGNWATLLAEFTFSPHWVIAAMDQYNYVTTGSTFLQDGKFEVKPQRLHYPIGVLGYVRGGNRFQINYGRQRAGIFCVGGVCREVPAANGLTLSITSTF
jgi:hypothetical protein